MRYLLFFLNQPVLVPEMLLKRIRIRQLVIKRSMLLMERVLAILNQQSVACSKAWVATFLIFSYHMKPYRSLTLFYLVTDWTLSHLSACIDLLWKALVINDECSLAWEIRYVTSLHPVGPQVRIIASKLDALATSLSYVLCEQPRINCLEVIVSPLILISRYKMLRPLIQLLHSILTYFP